MNQNQIPVVISSDNKIFFTVAAVLAGLAKHALPTTHYDVHVLCAGDVTEENKNKVKSMAKDHACLSVDFVDMGDKMRDIPKTHDYVNYVSAYKMLIPSLFPKLDKVLYLDTDILVRGDLTELWETPMGDNYLMGVPAMENQITRYMELKELLKIPSMDFYINAGMMLMNLAAIRRDKIDEKWQSMLGRFSGSVDQHILNHVCYGRIGFVPQKYNLCVSDIPFMTGHGGNIFYSSETLRDALENPVVVHYTGHEKPWKFVNVLLAHEWVLRYYETPFAASNLQRGLCWNKTPPSETVFSICGLPILKTRIQKTKIKYYMFGLKIAMKKNIEKKEKPAKK